MPVRRARLPRAQPRQPKTGSITPEQVVELHEVVERERDREPIADLAAARRNALELVLTNLIARWLRLERRSVDGWTMREVVQGDPDVAACWRLYCLACDEADHDEDARDRTQADRVLRLAVRRGYSPLNAVRAGRRDAALRKEDVESEADYQRARRLARRLGRKRHRDPAPRGAFWELMVF